MKYTVIFCLIFCVSCSWMTSFVFVNNTSHTIHICYKLRKNNNGKQMQIKEIGIPEVSNSLEHWQPLKKYQYQYNSQLGTINIDVLPGQAILLARIVNYTGHQSHKAQYFDLESLEIRTKNTTTSYKKRKLLLKFQKSSNTLYVFSYKGGN